MAGGALTEISWRLAFLVNVPIGLLVIYLARSALRETEKERMKLDAERGCAGHVGLHRGGFLLIDGCRRRAGCRPSPSASGLVALAAFVAFAVVERTAENPIVPFSLFSDRNRLATFAAMFLSGGVTSP